MNRTIPFTLSVLALCLGTAAQGATIEELEKRIEQLEAQKASSRSSGDRPSVTLYGSIRPAVTYTDDKRVDQADTDITDFLSRIGIKSSYEIGDNLSAFAQGEWDVDIEADADFGDARLGFVGLEGNWGRVAIGKQWNPYHNIVALATDLFNHRSSPFGYDVIGPFRTNNMLTYNYSVGGFALESGVQLNGDPSVGVGRGGPVNANDGGAPSGASNVDEGSIGVSYSTDLFYVGVSYREVHDETPENSEFVGVGASINITDDLYLGASFQDIELADNTEAETFDVAASYALPANYKVKAAVFATDELAGGYDGFNLTLEKQFTPDVRTFIEFLQRDFDVAGATGDSEVNAVSVGIRYDFSTNI